MDDVQTLERLEREWIDALARGDAAALGRILDEEFVVTDPHGVSMTAGQCLEALESGELAFDALEVVSLHVRLFGDTGVVVGVIRMKGRAGERRYDGEYSFVDVYARRGGEWKAILSSGDGAAPILGAAAPQGESGTG